MNLIKVLGMYRSILLPVGSSDIDGPDLIVIAWCTKRSEEYRRRLKAVQDLSADDQELTCARYRDDQALAFMMPEEDAVWLNRIEEMHAENNILAVEETPEYFAERWGAGRVPMPDPARVSIYPSAEIFFSGPIGLSSLRWETSCGLSLEDSGFVSPARKNPLVR